MEPFRVDDEMATLLGGMEDEDLHSFTKLQEDPASDEQIELCIYSHLLLFDKTQSTESLDQAVQQTEGWLAVTPIDHPDRTRRSHVLDMLVARQHQYDLLSEDIISMFLESRQESRPGGYDREISSLNEGAVRLAENYRHSGRLEDLNEAIGMMDQAMKMAGRYIQPYMMSNLGAFLGMRFDRTGSIDDLNRAVNVADQAVNATPADHPDRAMYLNNLGNRLGTRFERTGSINDLNRAVYVADQAVNATPIDHPDRAGRLNNLGSWLGRRFDRIGSIDDLNRAADVADQAADATPIDHPDRAAILNNLGNRLCTRFERTGSIDDLNRRLSSYEEGWRCYTAPPSIRIRLARQAAQIRAEQLDWEGSSHLLQQAVEILPVISPRWLKHTDKQHMLADFAGLASAAAATALNAGKDAHDALRFLELGRGIIASLLIETRGDISDLKQKHPSLADEFISLRDEIDLPGNDSSLLGSIDKESSWESLSRRRREAVQELDKVRSRIRVQAGFENFHLPPTINELKAAADPDPIIVVNLSPYRCDAFLIECNQIRILELPNLTLEQIPERTKELQTSLLEWLWDVVARPVLDALGFREPITDTKWPRVWWVPTGLLSQLPLHAAGYYTNGSSETILDRVMSSYTSTVKSLIHGRQLHLREPVRPVSDHALLVAMPETPNLPANGSLPFTVDEGLQACRIFHFAGHGHSDPAEPSQSCLLLEDWKTNPLTVGDLRDHRLQENPPFLGFLSACSTGANRAAKLADEGINLINAFQLAGFRHVVGTLWEVSDMHCVDVARVLYETLRDEGMTDAAVCRGLHRAVRALRDGGIGVEGTRDGTLINGTTEARGATNAYWIPYVHFGV
ncbi:CHAT domain-containing protein [Xylariaceae sp. AK1471]|nr:CHAT domain-containing protein [Xylariaceae sp. AK1471]